MSTAKEVAWIADRITVAYVIDLFQRRDAESWTYNSNGYIASFTDWNGHLTTWVRDARGLETSRTEASGTPQGNRM